MCYLYFFVVTGINNRKQQLRIPLKLMQLTPFPMIKLLGIVSLFRNILNSSAV